jgi:predicted DNA-binding protein
MAKSRSPKPPAPNAGDEQEDMLWTHLDKTMVKRLKQLAAELGVSKTTIVNEAIALLFRDEGVALPSPLVEHLKAHGRPIPPGAKREKPKAGLH